MENNIIVRKILSEALTSVNWDPDGVGPMTAPFVKAKKQAEYLKNLPHPLRRYFPEVFSILNRSIPAPPHLQRKGVATYREAIYEMSYLPGEEISQFIRKFSPPPQVVAHLYKIILKFLREQIHIVNRNRIENLTLDVSYFQKIENRLALCRKTAPRIFDSKLLDSEEICINGKSYFNCLHVVDILRKNTDYQRILEPRFHSLVMGDTNTENIKITDTASLINVSSLINKCASQSDIEDALNKITADSLGLGFLDPRAIGFNSDGANTNDDPMYDNKPWHNSIGHYDEIHHEFFDLRVHNKNKHRVSVNIKFKPNNPFQKSYRVRDISVGSSNPRTRSNLGGLEDYFASVMTEVFELNNIQSRHQQEDPYWLIRFVFVMGTHFAAMPPFHFQSEIDGTVIDEYQIQRRPLAIYCEGVKWLNWALELMTGDRKRFLGIKAPHLPYHQHD